MSKRVAVRKRDADKVLAAVKRAYGSWIDAEAEGPVLIKDYETLYGGPVPYAIVWEGGPYQWSYLFPFGGIEEEFGSKVPDVSDSTKGVFIEAINHYAVAIYEG